MSPRAFVGASVALVLAVAGVTSSVAPPPPVAAAAAPTQLPGRDHDPVVLRGAEVPAALGWAPARVVAFRWWRGQWRQIPVQVDERARVDLRTVYGPRVAESPYPVPSFVTTVYTDPQTFTGPDPDRSLDANDEIALMARDAGGRAPAGTASPSGTVGALVRVWVRDPLTNAPGWFYLARQDGSLDQAAGRPYVSASVQLLSGGYKATYRTTDGPNPENTTVSTPSYALHFSDRWVLDRLAIGGIDLLDREKFMFYAGFCGRSENTFIADEGAWIAQVAGPVRFIRSVIGANSGPLTVRTWVVYRDRVEQRTNLRVHPIPGAIEVFDLSQAAVGSTYRTNLDTAGVTVDGQRDDPPQGQLRWEQVSAPFGSFSQVHDVWARFPIERSSYYLDTFSPAGGAETQCTGDAQAIGVAGPTIGAIASTDPSAGGSTLTSRRVIDIDPPASGPAVAESHAAGLATGLRAGQATG